MTHSYIFIISLLGDSCLERSVEKNSEGLLECIINERWVLTKLESYIQYVSQIYHPCSRLEMVKALWLNVKNVFFLIKMGLKL